MSTHGKAHPGSKVILEESELLEPQDSCRWYHITTHTYSAWLHGDPRGFRTHHHREHVEGDYKNPPAPGTFDREFARSKQLLKQDPVVLATAWRKVVGEHLAIG
ncbi:MAG: hypothetical protein C0467_04485 [Planctomycetaceae bacterium]|nr:hypothetical protein [Planctomycetaceae bacterium]